MPAYTRRALALWLVLAPTCAMAQATLSPRYKSIQITSTGSTGAIDGMTVGGTALSTALPAKAPLASPVFTGTVRFPAYTVATLPTCAAATQDAVAVATDTTAPTYRGALTGGGTVRTLVYCDGTSWTSH